MQWYEINIKDQEIFCKSWLPEPDVQLKGALCFCHGYGDTCTFFFEGWWYPVSQCWFRYSTNAKLSEFRCRHFSDIISHEGVIYVITHVYVPGIAKQIASCGYAVYAIDHPGFGLSEGLHGYVSSFDDIVDNVIEQFTIIKGVDCKVAWLLIALRSLIIDIKPCYMIRQ